MNEKLSVNFGSPQYPKDFGIKPFGEENDLESELFNFSTKKNDAKTIDYNSPDAWDAKNITGKVPDVKYNAKEVTKAYYDTDGKRAEEHGVFDKNAVTLNKEQSIDILKKSGYDVDNCKPNIAEDDGTVSFQFGDQHVRVVVDSKTGEVGILKTQIQGEKTLVTRYEVKGAKVDKNQPDSDGNFNKTQIKSIVDDFYTGREKMIERDENGLMTGGLHPLLSHPQIYEAVSQKVFGMNNG